MSMVLLDIVTLSSQREMLAVSEHGANITNSSVFWLHSLYALSGMELQ